MPYNRETYLKYRDYQSDYYSRNADKYTCTVCHYSSHSKANLLQHYNSDSHQERIDNHTSIKPKPPPLDPRKYNCSICDYYTPHQYEYDNHLRSIKHKRNIM